MKMCRLEDVGCEFGGVGCDGRFRRGEQEDHTRQNSQKHLTLTASLAVETRTATRPSCQVQRNRTESEAEARRTGTKT